MTALDHLRAGCAAQDAQPSPNGHSAPFTAVGLHLLHGLVLAARDDVDAARAELTRELAFEASGHIYARECCANAWYAIGALNLRQGCRDEAAAAFRETLTRLPGHELAAVGLAAVTGERITGRKEPAPSSLSTVIAEAARLALQGRHDEAAHLCVAAIAAHPDPAAAEWQLTVEPNLHIHAHREAWTPVLATLRARWS